MGPADCQLPSSHRSNVETYQDFLCIADPPCHVPHVTIGADNRGRKFNAEPRKPKLDETQSQCERY